MCVSKKNHKILEVVYIGLTSEKLSKRTRKLGGNTFLRPPLSVRVIGVVYTVRPRIITLLSKGISSVR